MCMCVNKMNASTETAEMRVSVYLSTRFWTPEASLQCGSMKAVLTERPVWIIWGQCILPLPALKYKTHLYFQEWAIFSMAKKQQIPSRIRKWHQKTIFFLLILFHRNTHCGNVPWIFKWFIHHFWMKLNAKTGMERRRNRRWHISLLKWRAEWNIVV